MVTTPHCAISHEINITDYAECEIPAELEAVRIVVEKLRAYCARHGLDAKRWSEVELAVVEGLNNAVEHGCEGRPGGRVQFRWSWPGEVLELRITDPSDFLPAAPAAAAEPELPEDLLSESGRGAFLMHAMMDEVEHRLEHGRHTLTLRKRTGRKTEALAEPDAETTAILQAMIEDLSANYESLSALFRFAEKLATASTFAEFVRESSRQLLELLRSDECHLRLENQASRALDLIHSEGGAADTRPAATLPADADFVESRVFRDNRQSTVEACARLPRTDPLHRDGGSAFACPVRFQDEVLGVFAVWRREGAAYFSAAEISVARVVAEFIGIARATATLQEQRREQQRAARELEIAAEIQQSLLPRTFPNTPALRIFGVSQASRAVGGDYFDVIPIEGQGVLLAIADVMGKGMPAALLATILRTSIRARLDLAMHPDQLLTEVNRQMQNDLTRLDMFITAQIAFLPEDGRRLVFASAAHCPILKSSPARGLEQLREGSVPLGVLGDIIYAPNVAELQTGDRLVFMTDGIYEVEAPNGLMLGLDAVARQVEALSLETPAALCDRLLEAVRRYGAAESPADDRTLLVVDTL